jgi:peroxiredoxin
MKYLLLCVLLFSSFALGGDPKSPEIGSQVPAFALKNYDGKELSLAGLEKENKLTVLMFISTQCPVSNGYNDRMEHLYETYHEKGVAIVGINANKAEDVAAIAEHAKEHGFRFPVLKDDQNKIADLYAAQVTPETFVISSTGKLLYHGRIDDSRRLEKVQSHDLADALDKLLAGKTPSVTQAKAFGCSIKRVVTD